jgi:hypothetical protein
MGLCERGETKGKNYNCIRMRNLSTLTEIYTRGPIFEISKSVIKRDTFIVIFTEGSQANINGETYYKLVAA